MKRMFLVMIFILISFSFGCGGYKSDMSGIKNLVQDEMFEQEGKYIIFFYREGCDGCEQTKPYILTYKNMLKEDKYKDCKMIYGGNALSTITVSASTTTFGATIFLNNGAELTVNTPTDSAFAKYLTEHNYKFVIPVE